MSDPLYDLLIPYLPKSKTRNDGSAAPSTDHSVKYLSRLLSLRPSDLTTTEPLSLSQASQSNLLSIQALSSRSHRTTTISSDHLSTLHESLPSISHSVRDIRESVPALDETAVQFATSYSKSRGDPSIISNDQQQNVVLTARKESQLLARQADKLQDILELPQLLSAAIASANSGTAGSANYSQALDLFAHIKRLQIIYPDSTLVKSVSIEAEVAMKDMTTNLITSLRSQNLRLPAAIRTIGWLRRVIPELGSTRQTTQSSDISTTKQAMPTSQNIVESAPSEGSFGLLFLTARLSIFLSMTDALSPLRELADQETERRLATQSAPLSSDTSAQDAPASRPQPSSRRPSYNPGQSSAYGQQTERYLKRYIEIFREQSFSTIDMYRKVFPPSTVSSDSHNADDGLELPSALQTYPLHLVEMLIDTLKTYLPNVTDQASRESLLMQTLYAANSLGRLGADFSMMISLLEPEATTTSAASTRPLAEIVEGQEQVSEVKSMQPEWVRVIGKHRVQSARLDALAAGQEQISRRASQQDVTVK